MNKKVRRYSLVQNVGPSVKYFSSEFEAINAVEYLNKLNNKKSEPCFYGKIGYEKSLKGYVVSYQSFLKVCEPMFLQEIDSMTMEHENSSSFRKEHGELSNRPIQIALRANGDITLLPVFYKKDKKYMDSEYLRLAIISRCIGVDFIYELYNDQYIDKSRKPGVYDALDKLIAVKEKVKYGTRSIDDLVSPAYDFYRSFIRKKDGSLDYRAKRYLAELIKTKEELEMSEEEKLEALRSEDEIYQYTLWDYMKHKTTN